MATNVEEAVELRRFGVGRARFSDAIHVRGGPFRARRNGLLKARKSRLKVSLELFYSLLTDLLELSAGCRNPCFAIRSSEKNLQL